VSKEFIRHLFPRVVLERNLRLTYTFCLGGLAFTTLLLLAFSGLLLIFYYQPTPETAYRSVVTLDELVWGGRFLRGLHRISSHALLTLVFLHTLRVVLTGAYARPRQLNWMIGALLMGLAIFEAYSGYLLPMDQLAYWATQTGMELIATAPFGDYFRRLLVPDGVGAPLTLLRFYALHILWLPLAIFSLSFLHFYRIRRNKGVLPYL
jgi:quinol-cytochrome oxidoreductase complex cytochrome b subunit